MLQGKEVERLSRMKTPLITNCLKDNLESSRFPSFCGTLPANFTELFNLLRRSKDDSDWTRKIQS